MSWFKKICPHALVHHLKSAMSINREWVQAQKAIFDKHPAKTAYSADTLHAHQKALDLVMWEAIKLLVESANAAGTRTFHWKGIIPLRVQQIANENGVELTRVDSTARTLGIICYRFSFLLETRDKSPERPA